MIRKILFVPSKKVENLAMLSTKKREKKQKKVLDKDTLHHKTQITLRSFGQIAISDFKSKPSSNNGDYVNEIPLFLVLACIYCRSHGNIED